MASGSTRRETARYLWRRSLPPDPSRFMKSSESCKVCLTEMADSRRDTPAMIRRTWKEKRPPLSFQRGPFFFVTSVCTVDLLMPNFCAAARTVVRFSMMYRARRSARSSMLPFKAQHSPPLVGSAYAAETAGMMKSENSRLPSLGRRKFFRSGPCGRACSFSERA